MDASQSLELLLKARTPLVVIESHDETGVVLLCREISQKLGLPLSKWSITTGLQRLEKGFLPQRFNSDPRECLEFIRKLDAPGLFLLVDFHPYLENPVHIRLLREIAMNHAKIPHHLLLLSHKLELPHELAGLGMYFRLIPPNLDQVREIIRRVGVEWVQKTGKSVISDRRSFDALARNLVGLNANDVERLARNAIFNDGMLNDSDLKRVQQAKYEMLKGSGVLSFEMDTANLAEVGGLNNLKQWLELRRAVFLGGPNAYGLDMPKGVMLLGVQGCGKSLAAKAVAGVWGVPLLRMDFAALYDKYMGETEKNLRESLRIAEMMSPCVLWADEVEKGLSSGDGDDGVSRRVLGTLLTWMNERSRAVFIVATANDVSSLPPELLRKGRFDEIFFVDLPDPASRANIFKIQLLKRKLPPENFNLQRLANSSEGFSGAEIEQALIGSLYQALAQKAPVKEEHILSELKRTRPLSVVMHEKVEGLRRWAATRTVPAN